MKTVIKNPVPLHPDDPGIEFAAPISHAGQSMIWAGMIFSSAIGGWIVVQLSRLFPAPSALTISAILLMLFYRKVWRGTK